MTPAKRAFDLLASAFGLVVLAPVFISLALLIKLEDGGAVFFRQERVGHRGKTFRMWKFRSMVVDAERRGLRLTVGKDPRITRIGYWIRRMKLDELPQLFNVIVGEMSLVGPRPETPNYVQLYTEDQRRVLDFVPGITDPASIRFRNESELLQQFPDPERAYCDLVMGEKIRINLDYALRATLWTDLLIIIATAAGSASTRYAPQAGDLVLSPTQSDITRTARSPGAEQTAG